MNKIIIGAIFLLSFYYGSQAQNSKYDFSEINEEHGNFFDSESNKSFIDPRLGVVPHSISPTFSKTIRLKEGIEFPEYFDLRNMDETSVVTSVKNQGPFGTCWAFATMAGIESNWLLNSFGDYDLSEKNLVTCHDWELGINSGGNIYLSMGYLSRWSGVIFESDDPYNSLNSESSCASGFWPYAFIKNVHLFPNDPNIIKWALMKYGALYISMHWDETYYNANDHTYCRDGNLTGGHAVNIVGWDDNMITTCGTGAWIVKNSWGSNWGDNGYFYISYDDNYAPATVAAFEGFIKNPGHPDAIKRQRLVSYDYQGWSQNFGLGDSSTFIATKFYTYNNNVISGLGTYTTSQNTTLNIYFYKSAVLDESGNIISFEDLIFEKKDVFIEFPGYHTLQFNAFVESPFFVVIEYYSPNTDNPVPVESMINNYIHPNIQSDIAWVSADGFNWSKVGSGITNREFNPCIKILHKTSYGGPVASFGTEHSNPYTDQNVSLINNSYGGTIVKSTWIIIDDEESVKIELDGLSNAEVVFTTGGYKSIALVIEDDNGLKDSTYIENFFHVGITSSQISGIDQEILIWPNPTSEIINLEFSQGQYNTLTIYNLLGKPVINSKIKPYQNSLTVEVSALTNGLYFIELVGQDKRVIRKFIKFFK